MTVKLLHVDTAYAAGSVDGFIKKTFTAMIEDAHAEAINAGIIEENVFDQGIRDLHRTAGSNGVFCYTFFKAIGEK